MNTHQTTVDKLSVEVSFLQANGVPFRISHGSTNSTRDPALHKKNYALDTSALCHVLKVDTVAKTALVEANVPMDRLVHATMRYDLVPPVVMDFPGITVGGGFSGTSGESSSFKHGFFNHVVNWSK